MIVDIMPVRHELSPMNRRTFVLAAAVLGALAAPAPEASQTSASRFLLASVVDKDGDPMAGLTADDFIVQEGGARCEMLNASPAQYPVAILIDTSYAARPDFQQLRTAVAHLVDRLSGRDVALYTFGDRAMKVMRQRLWPILS